MLTRREWHLLRREFDEVRRVVEPTLDEVAARHLRDWFDVGEQGFGMDLLVALLLFERIPIAARTHELIGHILAEMGPIPGDTLPYLSDPPGVAALLDREGEPLRHRGLPPQHGGHSAARRRTVAFPPGWSERQIRRAAAAVAEGPATAHLANSRVWRTAAIDDVPLGVLTTPAGEQRAVLALAPPEVWLQPSAFTDPQRPALAELLVLGLQVNCTRLREALPPSGDEAEVWRQLQLAAEYDELADALVARADHDWPTLDPDARQRARALLRTFDLPVEGCAHLNDRDATLARWAG